jgi:hypothetical protein
MVLRNASMLDEMMAANPEAKHLISRIKDGAEWTFASSLPTVPTSEKVSDLAVHRRVHLPVPWCSY